jgi:hypothetical protein
MPMLCGIDVVMNGMLAFLLFAGAMTLDLSALRDRAWPVATLALVGTVISTAIVGSAFWAVTFFRVASTATGSVGLIRAPKTSAQASETGCPDHWATAQKALPTMAVEMTVPTRASVTRSRCSPP